MTSRSHAIAEQFDQAVAEFIGVVEPLTIDQWRTLCPNEERSIAVLSRHVARAIPFQMSVFNAFASGEQPATIGMEELADINAADAIAWADSDRDETIALLRANAATATAWVRSLSDDDLARTDRYITDLPNPWTLRRWLERIFVGHIHGHLDSIHAALGAGNDR